MTLTLWCPKTSYERLKSIAGDLTLPCEVAAKAVDPKGVLPWMPGEGVLLLMGGALADNLKTLGLVKKNASLASMREQAFAYTPSQDSPIHLMATYDPLVTEQSSERLVDLLWDLQLAARLASTGSLSPPLGQYQWVDNFDEIEWRTANGEADRLSLDLETLGLDPFDPKGRILTVALTDAERRSAVYRVPPRGRPPKAVLAQLRRLLCGSVRIQGANLKYDLLWLAVHWDLRGVNQTFDTHLVGSLLDENRSNSLETHAKIYTPLGGYDTAFNRAHDKGRMDLALEADPDGFLTYAGGDTDACHRVAKVQRRLLTLDRRLTRFYARILQPASRVFAKIEERGVVVDRERYKELEAQCRKEQAEHAEAAFKLMPRRLILKYADNLSLTRPELIREFMFTPRGLDLEPEIFTDKGSKPATSAEHLNRFADHPVAGPFVRAMEKYNATTKTLSTYIVGFQRFIRADGRFHPQYKLGRGAESSDETGTVTGRLSATAPAYQCQPAWARVLTRDGYRTMAEIIEALERAQPVEVLAHDGSWRRAHTPYRNGPQPVYRLTLEDGKALDCTGNHPVLTDRGWVEVQYLNAQDRVRVHDAELPEPSRAVLRATDRRGTRRVVFAREVALRVPVWARARGGRGQSDQWQHHELRLQLGRRQAQAWPSLCLAGGPTGHVAHVPSVGQHEGAVRQPDANQLSALRWARDHVLRPLAKLPAILGGHGRVPSGPDVGAHRCGWTLRAGQLHMDSTGRAEPQQAQFAWAAIRRLEVLTGSPETFGIAVEGTHSYVSEGIVNHNTIPKRTAWAKPLRSVYPCPPGHGIAKLDFNQGELRIMACLADDPTMIDAYRHNKDLHSLTAAATMGLTVEQFVTTLDEWVREEKRRAAKAINFGLLYGMMPPGLVDYARKSYGVEMSLQQAEHYWDTFFATYARLPKYHARMKKLAHAEGQVRNPLGRIRHLPLIHSGDQATRSLAERQAINSPIQSALSDLMLLAMVQLDARLPDLWIFGMTHDSVEMYVPLDQGPELVAMAKETLENLPVEQFGWHPQITFRADPEYTDHGTLADVKKVA